MTKPEEIPEYGKWYIQIGDFGTLLDEPRSISFGPMSEEKADEIIRSYSEGNTRKQDTGKVC